jgi:hypothetical protein
MRGRALGFAPCRRGVTALRVTIPHASRMAADAALFAKGAALARYKGLPPKTTDEIAEGVNFVAFWVPAKALSACYPGLADGQRCSALHLMTKRERTNHDGQNL